MKNTAWMLRTANVFQVAVYAEFRRDWVEVLKFYEAAYSLLQEVTSDYSRFAIWLCKMAI
jgi:hypothetical protein